eukprot:6332912-Prymnesium_polylepis.1
MAEMTQQPLSSLSAEWSFLKQSPVPIAPSPRAKAAPAGMMAARACACAHAHTTRTHTPLAPQHTHTHTFACACACTRRTHLPPAASALCTHAAAAKALTALQPPLRARNRHGVGARGGQLQFHRQGHRD